MCAQSDNKPSALVTSAMDPRKSAPGYTGEEHPEIVDIRAMPPQPKELKPGQVPENLIKQYFQEASV